MSLRSWRRALTAVAVVPALTLTLAVGGCGAEDEVAERLTEEAVEGAAGGDADIDIEDDGVTITDENGEQASIGTKLPEDFPVDDVPLVEGTVVSATAVDGATYMVILEVEGTPEEAQEQALGMLTDAGFSSDSEMNAEGFFSSELSKDGYGVTLSAFDNTGTTNLQYVVAVS